MACRRVLGVWVGDCTIEDQIAWQESRTSLIEGIRDIFTRDPEVVDLKQQGRNYRADSRWGGRVDIAETGQSPFANWLSPLTAGLGGYLYGAQPAAPAAGGIDLTTGLILGGAVAAAAYFATRS